MTPGLTSARLLHTVSRARPPRTIKKWSWLSGRTRPGCERPARSTVTSEEKGSGALSSGFGLVCPVTILRRVCVSDLDAFDMVSSFKAQLHERDARATCLFGADWF